MQAERAETPSSPDLQKERVGDGSVTAAGVEPMFQASLRVRSDSPSDLKFTVNVQRVHNGQNIRLFQQDNINVCLFFSNTRTNWWSSCFWTSPVISCVNLWSVG